MGLDFVCSVAYVRNIGVLEARSRLVDGSDRGSARAIMLLSLLAMLSRPWLSADFRIEAFLPMSICGGAPRIIPKTRATHLGSQILPCNLSKKNTLIKKRVSSGIRR